MVRPSRSAVVFHSASKGIIRVVAHQGVATLHHSLAPNQMSRVSATFQGNLFTLAATDTRATYQSSPSRQEPVVTFGSPPDGVSR
jgi:hypothetical protein